MNNFQLNFDIKDRKFYNTNCIYKIDEDKILYIVNMKKIFKLFLYYKKNIFLILNLK